MKKFLFILLLIIPFISSAQARKVYLYHADNFFVKEDYHNALLNYQKALSDSAGIETITIPYEIEVSKLKIKNKELEISPDRKVPLKDYLLHQIATCYSRTFDYKKAVGAFEETSNFTSFPDDLYNYAVAKMNVNDHQEAIQLFESYIQSDNYSDSLLRSAQLLITGCYYALDETNLKKEVIVELLDTAVFNKGTSSFAPMFFGKEDRLMFSSARKGGVIFDPKKQQSEFLCDIYWTEQNSSGDWKEATNFGRPLNSAQHDASGYYSPKNIIYYNRWNDANPKDQKIHLARMVDFKFYESFTLPESVNVPGYKSINPFVSMDGKTLYFASDRPGGQGGLDLWQIELDENGNVTGEASNLGRPINSELDEQSPFMHEISSTLFFSSKGHNSIGGLDNFMSKFNKQNKSFEKPINLGFPINSSKDDAYLIWDDFIQTGYFSSDREDCPNGHCYNIYEVTNEPIQIAIEGYVFDSETDEIIPNSTITFKDIEFKMDPFEIKTDEKGYYHSSLQQNQELFIKATKPKYFADATSIDTKPITITTTLQHDFYLRPIPTEEIEIEGIEYDLNSAKLRPISQQVLDELKEFLLLNDNLVVEISSHTDYRGTDNYNQRLSEQRAKSCVDYLIKKGIDKERLIATGYGESQPNYLKGDDKKPVLDENGNRIILTQEFIDSEEDSKLKDSYHQRNRRTSFRVVGEGFNIDSK
ncbi:MAG: OmpA family protein [Crocinitomicaceae bacterium]|nr:OmpA family protein [Crocinitomicaceae bacterium]